MVPAGNALMILHCLCPSVDVFRSPIAFARIERKWEGRKYNFKCVSLSVTLESLPE
jgi:hypothetical protein